MIPEMPDRIIDVRDVFHNINMLLKYYRHFKLYCEHAVDAIDWHLHDHHFQTDLGRERGQEPRRFSCRAE